MIVLLAGHDSFGFDESDWRKAVETQETEKLFAPHSREGRFFNPWMPLEHGGFLRLLKWKLFSARQEYTDEEKAYRPQFLPGLKDRILSLPATDFIAWAGHGAFLMRLGGTYWLTDPMFSDRAFLPKRVTPPAVTGEDLHDLNGPLNVIISHNHYDHLDAETIRSLPRKTRFFVPLGLKDYVRTLHDGDITEMDWWDKVDAGSGTTIFCLPAQHWSKRLGQGTNTTLWASFLLATPSRSIYFGGDSGYFVGYREFGRRFPDIEYALIPTTAYHPRWFMHYAHMDIQESLDGFQALRARFFVPTQWGTFHLGDEPPGYPALDLKRAIREKGLDPSRFLIMDIGEIHCMK